MAGLRADQLRRLISYLSRRIQDTERLAEIEDELRDEYAEEFLREPDLLIYFPEETIEIVAANVTWLLRFIPHALLRMVQRGIPQAVAADLFRRFVEKSSAQGQIITVGPYTISGQTGPRGKAVTLRADVDHVADTSGEAHVVTVLIGLSNDEDTITVMRS